MGGWVATRSSGMKKNVYGNIEDLVIMSSLLLLWYLCSSNVLVCDVYNLTCVISHISLHLLNSSQCWFPTADMHSLHAHAHTHAHIHTQHTHAHIHTHSL